MSNIDSADILIFLGLALMGVGLFYWLGIGVALAVVGALLFLYGVLSASGRTGYNADRSES